MNLLARTLGKKKERKKENNPNCCSLVKSVSEYLKYINEIGKSLFQHGRKYLLGLTILQAICFKLLAILFLDKYVRFYFPQLKY